MLCIFDHNNNDKILSSDLKNTVGHSWCSAYCYEINKWDILVGASVISCLKLLQNYETQFMTNFFKVWNENIRKPSSPRPKYQTEV
jgi:hypothetical protein